jgi:branched-chain amino acid transport system ATP-binding protein
MTGLQIKDLHVHLAGAYIIQGVEFAADRGRTVAIVGQNGAGKTTLVRSIMGLTGAPSRGDIMWQGANITRTPPWKRAAAGIGYVPQSRRIFQSLTVEENLRVAQKHVADNRWTIPEIFRLFPNLEQRRHLRSGLSGGEQQMLAIARALVGAPKLIILDEPTEGLSPAMVARVLQVLQTLKREGYGILLVEQSFRFVAALADDVYLMQAGRMLFCGSAMSESEIADMAAAKLGLGRKIIDGHAEG